MEHNRIKRFNENSELNISDVSDSFINENKTQLEADVELKLIKFFEEFDYTQYGLFSTNFNTKH